MKKTIPKALYALFLLTLAFPLAVLADGMIVPPPDYWMRESDQKAVIFYDQGIETMVLSVTFSGNAKEFAWVVPVPSKPDISKGSDNLFTSLQELTGNIIANDLGSTKLSLGLGAAEQSGVTVVETKQVEYYDVAVLSSTDENSLVKWLNDNGYNFPKSAGYILDSYIQNKWYFVAMKINSEALGWTDVSQQLRTGHAVPVMITFKNDKIVYPLKISSAMNHETVLGVSDSVTVKNEIAIWNGKVNQHYENGLWKTDPDGSSGSSVNKLSYCNKWYPGTTEVITDDLEYIEGFKNAGNTGDFAANVQTYQCYSGTVIVPPVNANANINGALNTNAGELEIMPVYPYYNDDVSITLYILTDHKKTAANFATDYAAWVKKSNMEKWANNEQGDPWISPENGKYFLTKLSRSMAYSEMNEDIYFNDATDNSTVNAVDDSESSAKKTVFYVTTAIGLFFTLGICFILFWKFRNKKY